MRFTHPVVVPDDDAGATIEVTGKVAAKLDGTGSGWTSSPAAGQKVLRARAVVRLA